MFNQSPTKFNYIFVELVFDRLSVCMEWKIDYNKMLF